MNLTGDVGKALAARVHGDIDARNGRRRRRVRLEVPIALGDLPATRLVRRQHHSAEDGRLA